MRRQALLEVQVAAFTPGEQISIADVFLVVAKSLNARGFSLLR